MGKGKRNELGEIVCDVQARLRGRRWTEQVSQTVIHLLSESDKEKRDLRRRFERQFERKQNV